MRELRRTLVRLKGMRSLLVFTIAIMGVIVACGEAEDSAGSSSSTSIAASSVTTPTPPSTTLVPSPTVGRVDLMDPKPSPGGIEEATQQAIDDLVARAAVASDQIDVSVAEELTWNDGSLGCPEPGKAYTQSLVPGLRVILTVDEQDYAYHAAEGGALFYCASPSDGRSTDT